MENIDKLFAQRFNEEKPENNYNSALWDNFEQQLQKEMPTPKIKRKWWMGWRGLTILNTILLGSILAVLPYMNEGEKFKVQSSKAGTELLITNDELQTSSVVEENEEISSSVTADESKKENNVVVKNKLQKSKPKNTGTNIKDITSIEATKTTVVQESIMPAEKTDVINTLQEIQVQIPNDMNINNAVPKTLNFELSTLNSQSTTHNSQLKSNIQTTKPKGPQYSFKWPDWLKIDSKPKHPRRSIHKEKPDIIPVPIEGF